MPRKAGLPHFPNTGARREVSELMSTFVLVRWRVLGFFVVMFGFAVSNGYLSTLCFVAGIELPTLDPHEVDLAGTCLALYLTFGLVAGALMWV